MVYRCIKGHYQPLLLLYADPRGTPVSAQDVPSRLDIHHLNKACYDSEDSGNYKTARSRSSSTAANVQVTKPRAAVLCCSRSRAVTEKTATWTVIACSRSDASLRVAADPSPPPVGQAASSPSPATLAPTRRRRATRTSSPPTRTMSPWPATIPLTPKELSSASSARTEPCTPRSAAWTP